MYQIKFFTFLSEILILDYKYAYYEKTLVKVKLKNHVHVENASEDLTFVAHTYLQRSLFRIMLNQTEF